MNVGASKAKPCRDRHGETTSRRTAVQDVTGPLSSPSSARRSARDESTCRTEARSGHRPHAGSLPVDRSRRTVTVFRHRGALPIWRSDPVRTAMRCTCRGRSNAGTRGRSGSSTAIRRGIAAGGSSARTASRSTTPSTPWVGSSATSVRTSTRPRSGTMYHIEVLIKDCSPAVSSLVQLLF